MLDAQEVHLRTQCLGPDYRKCNFAHPIFGPYFMYCAPNFRLLPSPLLNDRQTERQTNGQIKRLKTDRCTD